MYLWLMSFYICFIQDIAFLTILYLTVLLLNVFLLLAIPIKYSSENTWQREGDDLILRFWMNQIFVKQIN